MGRREEKKGRKEREGREGRRKRRRKRSRTGPGQERASPLSSFKLALCPLAGYVEKSGWARGGELIASPVSWIQQDHSWSGN